MTIDITCMKTNTMKALTLLAKVSTNVVEITTSIFKKESKVKNKSKVLTWSDLKHETPEDLKKALQRCQRKLLSPNPSNIKAEIKKMKEEFELA